MRNGKTLRQRLDALGFGGSDFDERVHDLLDWVEGVVETCEEYQKERGVEGAPGKGVEAVTAFLNDSSPY